jgi:hypothetical protein
MEGDLMRKFLVLATVVGLALLMAAPAMALDFKFGAEYRVRFYSNLNGSQANLGIDDGANSARGVQVRIRPRFDVSDDNGNMTATLRLEIGDVEWGNGGGPSGAANGVAIPASGARVGGGAGGAMGADGVNVETKWAYVDFASPWGFPLRWRAGLQPWFESKGLIVDDDVAGVRAYGKASIVNYEVGWYRASGGPCTNTATATVPSTANIACNTSNALDNNYDFYEAKAGFAIAKWLNPSVYGIYGRNAATNTAGVGDPNAPQDTYFLGAAVNGDAGFLRYDLDFVYGRAEGGPNGNLAFGGDRVKTKGWGVDGGVHFPIGPVLLHVVGSYATGDKQNGGDSEALPYIAPSWNGAGGLYEIIGSGGVFDQVDVTQDYPGGLWMLGAGVEYRPVKALWMRAMYGYAGFTDKKANCAFTEGAVRSCFGPTYRGDGYNTATGTGGLAGENSLGQEISLRADYDLWTNFKIQGAAGWLIPSEGSTVHEYVLQLYYSF